MRKVNVQTSRIHLTHVKTAASTTSPQNTVRMAATPDSSRHCCQVHTLPAAFAASSTVHCSSSQLEVDRQVMAGAVEFISGRWSLVPLLLLVRR